MFSPSFTGSHPIGPGSANWFLGFIQHIISLYLGSYRICPHHNQQLHYTFYLEVFKWRFFVVHQTVVPPPVCMQWGYSHGCRGCRVRGLACSPVERWCLCSELRIGRILLSAGSASPCSSSRCCGEDPGSPVSSLSAQYDGVKTELKSRKSSLM